MAPTNHCSWKCVSTSEAGAVSHAGRDYVTDWRNPLPALINTETKLAESPAPSTDLVLANATISGAATIAKIAIDCSDSMSGVIAQANAGLDQAVTEMANDEIACDRVVLSQYAFGGTAYKVAGPALPRDLKTKHLSAGGGTPGGEVLSLMLADLIREQQGFAYEGTRVKIPWFILTTDGAFNDADWQTPAKRVRDLAVAGKLNMLVAYHGAADVAQLTLMCAPDQPPMPLDQTKFADFFKWVTVSLIDASGTNPDQAPPTPPMNTWVAR